MSAQALIRQAQASGVALRLIGGKVKASGPREAVIKMLAPLRQHRAEIEAVLNEPTTTPPPIDGKPHVQRLHALGLDADEAQATALRVQAHLQARRWGFDDRVMCWHCAELRTSAGGWLCGNWRTAGIGGAALGRDLMNLPQRCSGYVGAQLVAQKNEGYE